MPGVPHSEQQQRGIPQAAAGERRSRRVYSRGHSANMANGYSSDYYPPRLNEPGPSYRYHTPPPGGQPRQGQRRAESAFEGGRRMPVGTDAMSSSDQGLVTPSSPSYWVEHLATFGMGAQFAMQWPADGIRKLRQMERIAAIWAQPMVLRLLPDYVVVEDENGEVVEQFPLELVAEPTAHITNDPRDVYNNMLLFVVREDNRHKTAAGEEMHIFQCVRVSANDVVEDIKMFLMGRSAQVQAGFRDQDEGQGRGTRGHSQSTATVPPSDMNYFRRQGRHPSHYDSSPGRYGNGPRASLMQDEQFSGGASDRNAYAREATDIGGEHRFERDVNTLNRCFDEIERFVARIQQAAIVQRELEQANKLGRPPRAAGMLAARAQLPSEREFVDVLQKFKLSFNLLARLRHHIHEPNAPELLHFLFTPLAVILDALRWSIGPLVASRVLQPLITHDAKELMLNCLTSKETELWLSLGDAWRVPDDEWPHDLPSSYHPVFYDGYMPYGPPGSVATSSGGLGAYGAAGDNRQSSELSLEMDKLSLEKERLAFEKDRLLDRERRLAEEERRLDVERRVIATEQRRLGIEPSAESSSLSSSVDRGPVNLPLLPAQHNNSGARLSPASTATATSQVDVVPSARQRAFAEELLTRHASVALVTHDRTGNNQKELTVSSGEVLQVLNDAKNWWECRNIANRVGFVPNTILRPMDRLEPTNTAGFNQSIQNVQRSPRPGGKPNPGISPLATATEDLPDYIRQRQGKRGEFRYF